MAAKTTSLWALVIGAARSMIVAGYLVEQFGYRAGFLALAAVALLALVFFWASVAETNPAASGAQPAR